MRRAFLAAALLLAGCNQVNLCSWRTVAVSGADGGPAACFSSDDCPRAGHTLVCATDGDPDLDCVRCVQGRCERTIGEACS